MKALWPSETCKRTGDHECSRQGPTEIFSRRLGRNTYSKTTNQEICKTRLDGEIAMSGDAWKGTTAVSSKNRKIRGLRRVQRIFEFRPPTTGRQIIMVGIKARPSEILIRGRPLSSGLH